MSVVIVLLKELIMTFLLSFCLAPAWLSQPTPQPLCGQHYFLESKSLYLTCWSHFHLCTEHTCPYMREKQGWALGRQPRLTNFNKPMSTLLQWLSAGDQMPPPTALSLWCCFFIMWMKIKISRSGCKNMVARHKLNSLVPSVLFLEWCFLFSSLEFTWGALLFVSMSSISSLILPLNYFCFLSNCSGLFASSICHCHLHKGNVDASACKI